MSWLGTWWSQVSATAVHGLQITVVGMLLVFFTLGLVILSLVVLRRLPGSSVAEQEDEIAASNTEHGSAEPLDLPPELGQDELAEVAAIAVALARARLGARRRPQAGTATSAWKRHGRAHQLGLQ